MTTTTVTTVTDAADRRRYEAHADGKLTGFADYLDSVGPGGAQVRVFTHTEVRPQFAGRGIGSALARGALDDLRTRQLQALPLCPFIAAWIERHADYQDLVYEPQPSLVHD